MTSNTDDFLAANARYVANFHDGDLPIPPRRKAAILTCMDARIDPDRILGLEIGDCHVIRNAGGRASDDAIRSLVVSYKLLGVEEFYVIHHTNCGMKTVTNEAMCELLAASLEPAERTPDGWRDIGNGPGSEEGAFIDWLAFTDEAAAVETDVRRIRGHPLIPARIPIRGFIYEVETGRLIDVPGANKIGAAK